MIVRAGFVAMLSLMSASAATGSPQIFGGGVISMPVNVAAPALVFGSDRDASAPSNAYIAFRTSGGWTAPLRLPDDSGIGNAIEFRLSPDENTLYFSRDGSIWSVPFAALREQLRNLAKP